MDPRDRLSAGKLAAREGRYEEALREYVWFHDHAIEHRKSLHGVRLSFALGYWMELAKAYPEARSELERIRDRKSATLSSGGGDRALFHDVKSINQKLGEGGKTYRLFRAMLSTSPLLAPACADLAMEAIVEEVPGGGIGHNPLPIQENGRISSWAQLGQRRRKKPW